MNLLPRLDEIIPTREKHNSCSYTIQALLNNNIVYLNYFEAECVSMPMIKVCPKCGKYRNVGRIPVPVNSATIQKYGIDIENNIKIKQKQIIELDFVSTPLNQLIRTIGTIQTFNIINYVSENYNQTISTAKEFLNANAINEIVQKWNEYSNLNYRFIAYDNNSNPRYSYDETVEINGVEVQIIYSKTIINYY